MTPRLRSLLRPDAHVPAPSPRAWEAFGGWMLGTVWALVCLWLGDVGAHSLLPGVLLLGVLALLGWRRLDWLAWLPPVMVTAALIEPLSPLALRGRYGALAYVDLLMAGVTAVAIVRAIALHRRPVPATSFDRVLVPLVLVSAAALLVPAHRGEAFRGLTRCLIGIGMFYATATVASRRGGARWVWPAFPLAAVLVGAHAIASLTGGTGQLARDAHAADVVWHASGGLAATLLCALPVCIGLALDAGEPGARRAWRIAGVIGAIGAVLHIAFGQPDPGPAVARLEDPMAFAALALSWVTLFLFARTAWRMSRARPHEAARWRALAGTFTLTACMQVRMDVMSAPTAALLLGIGGGLAAGSYRAARRELDLPVEREVEAPDAAAPPAREPAASANATPDGDYREAA